jgi:Xaa-Pro aminopeptidase
VSRAASPERADRIAAKVAERDLDALLVTDLTNVRYLTGFTGSNALAVVQADGGRRFVTDFRYVTQAAEEVGAGWERPEAERDLLGEGLDAALPPGVRRLGVDDAHLSYRDHQRVAAREGLELVGAAGLVEELRRVKDAGEIETIRTAARIADEAFEAVVARGLVGRTEREVALDLETEMRRLGADAASFDSIVAASGHGGRPHAVPRDEPIPREVLVTIDWGARVEGYNSDCTRTVATGQLDEEAVAIYELVQHAQQVSLEAVAAGRTGREVDAVARDIIEAAGHGDHFGHGLGHGVGLQVHEAPTLSKRGEDALAAGNVVTVEPGVYLPDRLGVRIEDLVVVTDAGRDVLSSVPKELRTVD